MANSIQIKRGVSASVAAYTPLNGELLFDTTTHKLYVGDGSTVGGNQVVASRKGITDGSAAATGEIGEVITAQTTATSYTSSSFTNLASVSLTAGDWDLFGEMRFNTTDAAFTQILGGLNTASATQPSFPNCFQLMAPFSALTQQFPVPSIRVNTSTSTTIYLVGYSVFASGSVTAQGYIRARRMR